jgi:hypothetical protein
MFVLTLAVVSFREEGMARPEGPSDARSALDTTGFLQDEPL